MENIRVVGTGGYRYIAGETFMVSPCVKSPWFLVETVDSKRQQVTQREYLETPYVEAEKKKGLLVGNWLLSLKPDVVVLPGDHQGTAAALLKEAGVDIQMAERSGR